MNLIKLTYNEIERLAAKVDNIETFKVRHKTAPASRLDLFKDIDTRNKRIHVANKDGSAPEDTYVDLY